MTKAELIKALLPFPENCTIYLSIDTERTKPDNGVIVTSDIGIEYDGDTITINDCSK